MANLAELEKTLTCLRDAGSIEDVDAARVEMLRSLAAALDEKPHSPGLWREYREALEGLRGDDDGDGSLEALLADLSSTVGDTPEA